MTSFHVQSLTGKIHNKVPLLQGALILYLSYLLLTFIILLTTDYHTIITWFATQYPGAYQTDQYSIRYFTTAHYSLIRQTGWITLAILATGIIILIRYPKSIRSFSKSLSDDLIHLYTFIRQSFHNLTTQMKWLLTITFFCLIAFRLYLFVTLPYHVDEVFSFVHFIDNGLLHISTYLGNHVLYNLLSAFWWKIGLPPLITSRITSEIAGILVLLIVYAAVAHFYNYSTALVALIFTGLSFWAATYSAEGRAYMLMTLCWLVSLISLLWYLRDGTRGYALFIISNIAGFYCVRLFIIPFASLLLLWGAVVLTRKATMQIMPVIWSLLIVTAGTSLLYLPMWLWSGTDALLLTSVSRHDLVNQLPALPEIFSVITGINSRSYLLTGTALIILALAYRKFSTSNKILFVLNVVSILAILLFIPATHYYPPSRGFIYHNVLFFATAGILISNIIAYVFKKPGNRLMALTVIILLKAGACFYIMNYGWQHSLTGFIQDSDFYQHLNMVTNDIMGHNPRQVFIDQRDEYLDFYLRLNALEKKSSVHIVYDSALLKESDVLILHNLPFTNNHEFILVNKDIRLGNIYFRKQLYGSSTRLIQNRITVPNYTSPVIQNWYSYADRSLSPTAY